MVPEPYRDFAKVFSEEESHRLPKHQPWDHAIDLEPDAVTHWKVKLYPMSPAEQVELDKWLEENLAKGYLRPSKSPMASPVFFIKKKDGKLRLVQDYRRLNKITIKNRYPLPLAADIVNRLTGAKHFTKFDVRWGYHNIHIKSGDEWKAAIITNRMEVEPTVMGFGMTNSPATFQSLMNLVFADVTNLQGPPSERTPEEKLWDFKMRAQQYARDRESCDDVRISYLEFLETEAEDDLALARMIAG
jgi:hypothetical protein